MARTMSMTPETAWRILTVALDGKDPRAVQAYEEAENALRELGESLGPATREKLKVIHEALGMMCNARDESLTCCIEVLLGDVERL
jgi:hypothetical protein